MSKCNKAVSAGVLVGVLGLSACESVEHTASMAVLQNQAGSGAPMVATRGELSSSTSNAVCDPFGAGTQTTFDHGIRGKLWYLHADQPRYADTASYLQNGHLVDANLFFSQISVPTRPFSSGFKTTDNLTLKTETGDTLFEYFALSFETLLTLGPNDLPGKYQFALLADDGAILGLDTDGTGFHKLVDDDGTHPTQMACASKTVRLDASSRIPLRLDYYQGPRYHIAVSLLWRQIPETVDETAHPSALSDSTCGVSGNTTFWDYTQTPSAPQPAFTQLQARGWKVLEPANFVLPNDVPVNPCGGLGQ